MKASRYNIFFDREGQRIGFNSYSKEYIVLDQMLYLMYETAERQSDFNELHKVHPAFFQFLTEKNFLVPEDRDEVALVKELVNSIDNDDSRFELHINPTMNCNFKCWYCYETHIKDSKMDERTTANTMKFMQSLFEQRTSIREFKLSWFGGEPLLYYKKLIRPMMAKAYQLCEANNIQFSSSITTNGLLIDQDVIDSAKQFNLSFFQITLDGDREQHNKVRFISEGRGSYDQIVTNIKQLVKHQLFVLVRINCSGDTLPGVKNIISDFEDLTAADKPYISFDIHKVWQEHYNIDNDTLTALRWYYREKGFDVATGYYDTVATSCYADRRNQALINYNGEIFKCTARDFTTANSEGVLSDDGAIVWNAGYEKRMNSKFNNKPCLECAIMPMCNGGCSQQAIEHEGKDYCVYDFDEGKKRQAVMEKFNEFLLAQ
ncbi:radical SAM/SPASM domain-containing protein [Chitinophaga solisilvae]|uniref:radical SAM/SPASM domain-containing protein n=1 Tax=Chitinophaga solisilvae TaxID=1233460 RepID=UPI00136A6430|nr:radical SAM protein [Chitinophaga solisilvae]